MVAFIIVAIILVIAFFIVLFWYISAGNKLARLGVKIMEANSGIDIALTKRYDTLTKMYEVAKGYLKHEQEVLIQTIRMRQGMTMPEKAQAAAQMSEAARQINVVAEAYPALASQTLFVELQHAITDTEEHLQAARRLYNSNVSMLNQMIVVFPSSIVANARKITPMPMFEAETAKRDDVNMAF